MRALFLFVDGVGLGSEDPASNPLADPSLSALRGLLGGRPPVISALGDPPGATGARLAALDACLGVPGLPQSGTGQTALLTGLNAPALHGAHAGPYPPPDLRPLLGSHGIWRRLIESGRRVAFANAFPDRYLDRARDGQGRMGTIARAAHAAGVRLRGPADLRAGRAISAFLTNEAWQTRLGYAEMPRIDEVQAGRQLAALARDHDFTLFEYYATDMAGHRPERLAPAAVLAAFDGFLEGVLASWPTEELLVIASDHGNLEDLRVRGHTLAPALGIWRGPVPELPLNALTDVAPAVLAALGLPASSPLQAGSP